MAAGGAAWETAEDGAPPAGPSGVGPSEVVAVSASLRPSQAALSSSQAAGTPVAPTSRTRVNPSGTPRTPASCAPVRSDSPDHHRDVVEGPGPPRTPDLAQPETAATSTQAQALLASRLRDLPEEPAPDVQAALTVLGRRPRHHRRHEPEHLDLHGLHLAQADLAGANLTGAQLGGANLTGAQLFRADLTGARLDGANLTRAQLNAANMTDARLFGADLTRAGLDGADLTGAQLPGAARTCSRAWTPPSRT